MGLRGSAFCSCSPSLMAGGGGGKAGDSLLEVDGAVRGKSSNGYAGNGAVSTDCNARSRDSSLIGASGATLAHSVGVRCRRPAALHKRLYG